jgi:hypothetical protein
MRKQRGKSAPTFYSVAKMLFLYHFLKELLYANWCILLCSDYYSTGNVVPNFVNVIPNLTHTIPSSYSPVSLRVNVTTKYGEWYYYFCNLLNKNWYLLIYTWSCNCFQYSAHSIPKPSTHVLSMNESFAFCCSNISHGKPTIQNLKHCSLCPNYDEFRLLYCLLQNPKYGYLPLSLQRHHLQSSPVMDNRN